MTGGVSASKFHPKYSDVEFVALVQQVADAHSDVELRVICDNYSTHNHEYLKNWQVVNPWVDMHFAPTSSFMLNKLAFFSGIITCLCLKRSSFTLLAELEATLVRHFERYKQDAKQFKWSKTANYPLGGMMRKAKSGDPLIEARTNN